MLEEIVFRKLEKQIIDELITTGKEREVCKELEFDETIFCLLLLEIKDKGIHRVKEIILKESTQETIDDVSDKSEREINISTKKIKTNIPLQVKEDFNFFLRDKDSFCEYIKMIKFLNQQITQKAFTYYSYIENLKIKVPDLSENKVFHYALKNKLIPTEEEYINLTKEIDDKGESTVASKILEIEEDEDFEEKTIQETGFIFDSPTNKIFFKQLSDDLKNLIKSETNEEQVSWQAEEVKSNIKSRLKLSVLDYNKNMKKLISRCKGLHLHKEKGKCK